MISRLPATDGAPLSRLHAPNGPASSGYATLLSMSQCSDPKQVSDPRNLFEISEFLTLLTDRVKTRRSHPSFSRIQESLGSIFREINETVSLYLKEASEKIQETLLKSDDAERFFDAFEKKEFDLNPSKLKAELQTLLLRWNDPPSQMADDEEIGKMFQSFKKEIENSMAHVVKTKSSDLIASFHEKSNVKERKSAFGSSSPGGEVHSKNVWSRPVRNPWVIPERLGILASIESQEQKPFGIGRGISSHPYYNQVATVQGDGKVQVLEFLEGEKFKEIFKKKLYFSKFDEYTSCAWSPGGEKIGISEWYLRNITVLDSVGRELLMLENVHNSSIVSLKWLEEDKIIIAGFDGTLKTFSCLKGGEEWSSRCIFSEVSIMEPLKKNYVLIGDVRGWVYCVDTSIGRVAWTIEYCHVGWVLSIALSTDESFFASSGQDGSLKVMRVADRRIIAQKKMAFPIIDISWAPGDAFILLTGSKTLQVFDQNLQDVKYVLDSFSYSLACSRFSHTSQEIYTGDAQGTLHRVGVTEKSCQVF